jgi:hypothetical protein
MREELSNLYFEFLLILRAFAKKLLLVIYLLFGEAEEQRRCLSLLLSK